MSSLTVHYFISVIKHSPELSPKEKEILINRLRHKTLKKLGRKSHVTGERIWQIEKSALKKFTKKINQLFLFS
jgi:DNA-directed RNA polymerase sigma subunit (sigma70/sigma32)